MCLSIVAKIIKIIDQSQALVDINGVRKNIVISMLEGQVEINDWVLVHTGFAIAKVDEQKAQEILSAYKLIDEIK